MKSTARATMVAVTAGAMGLASVVASAETQTAAAADEPIEVHFIDVGQADGSYIELPGGVDIVVDCGRWTDTTEVRDYLIEHEVDDIELLVASHPNADHIGGCDTIMEHFDVEHIVDNGMTAGTQTYDRYEDARSDEIADGAVYEEADYQSWDFGDVTFDVMGPVTPDSGDANNNSVVTRLDTGVIEVLFTGDIDAAAESEVRSRAASLGLDLSAEILKVPHHGSAGSSSSSFLETVQADVGIISVGGNPYGHPTQAALNRLAEAGTDVYRTDQEGDILVEIEDSAVWLNDELVVGEDTAAPGVQTDGLAPEAGATDVPVSAEVSATFDEAVVAGDAFSEVTLTAGGAEVPDLDVSMSAARLTIGHGPLEHETEYTATIPAGAVTDEAGNPLEEDITWSFTTAAPDVTPPGVAELTPADGATEVSLSAVVSATFDEPVVAGENLAESTITADGVEIGWVEASVSADTLTIEHDRLEREAEYTVTVPAGAVADESGNPLEENITWSFTTGTSSQVLRNPSFEEPGSNGAEPSSWTPVLLENETEPYNFQAVTYGLGGQYPPPEPVPDGDFALEMFWQVGSDMGVMGVAAEQTSDQFGVVSNADAGTLSYSAVQTYYADPSVVDWAGGLVEVELSSSGQTYLLRYFHPGSASYSGEPENADDGSVRYVVSEPFPGNGTWITAEQDLAADVADEFGLAEYTVEAIRVGNLQERTGDYPFSNMTTYWDDVSMMAAAGEPDTTPPEVAALAPQDGASGVSVDTDVTVTFDEQVLPGDALSGVSVTAGGSDVDGVEPAISGSTMTITDSVLTPGTEYTVTVPAAAVVDLAGNELQDDVSWSFITASAPAEFVEPGPLAAGEGFSLAVNDGTVWSWGTGFHGDGEAENARPEPAAGPDLTDIAAVTTGGENATNGAGHSLAVATDGTPWGWGRNNDGQLGDGGTESPRLTPVQPSELGDVVALEANSAVPSSIAGFSLALRDDGTVWGWGGNGSGQLGDGTDEYRSAPIRVGELSGVVDIAAGGLHGLALTEDGSVWTWGVKWFGLAGDGDTAGTNRDPVQVPGLSDVVAVEAGQMTSYALRSDGSVWAWGRNNNGNIGDGTTDDAHEPVQVPGLSDVVEISASETHALAVTSDGTVWSWGSNEHGALGNGTHQDRLGPGQVGGLTEITSVAAGVDYSLAVDSDGQVWAWGRNADGELGIGTAGDDRTTPVAAEIDLGGDTTAPTAQVLVNPSFEQPGSNGASPSGWSPVLLENESAPYNFQAVTYGSDGQYPPPAPIPDGEFGLEMFWQVGSNMGVMGVAAEQTSESFGVVNQDNVGTLSYSAVQTFYADPSVVDWAGGLVEVEIDSGGQSRRLRYLHPNSASYSGEPADAADGSVGYVLAEPFPGNDTWITAEQDVAADVSAEFGVDEFTVTAVRIGNLQERTGEYPFSNMTTYWDNVRLEVAGDDKDTTPPAVADGGLEPADGATGVDPTGAVSVTFDEPVQAGEAIADVVITADGEPVDGVEAAASGRALTITHGGLAPDTTHTVTVPAGAVTDAAGNTFPDPITWSFTTADAPPDYTLINDVQGTGGYSPMAGDTVTIEGVVTGIDDEVGADYDRTYPEDRGIFVQSLPQDDDGDARTSEAVFVGFVDEPSDYSPGDVVRVTGQVKEKFGLTMIAEQTGQEPQRIGSTDVPEPVVLDQDEAEAQGGGRAYYESLENMLVELPVGTANSGGTNKFGELFLTPGTEQDEYVFGEDAPASLLALDADAGAGNPDNPYRPEEPSTTYVEADHFDRVENATGPLAFSYGNYKLMVQPSGMPTVVDGPTAYPYDGLDEAAPGELRVVSFNVLNFFPEGGSLDLGTVSEQEYTEKRDRIADAIDRLLARPDVVAVQEVVNQEILDDLADTLGGYSAYLIDGNDSRGIDVGYLVKDTVEASNVRQLGATVGGCDDSGRLYDRPPLAIDIAAGDVEFTIINNHFKSKSGPDSCRDDQAAYVRDQVAALENDGKEVVVTGDLNSFETDNAIDVLESGTTLTNLWSQAPEDTRYSSHYQGQLQTLDHTLITDGLDDLVADFRYAPIGTDYADRFDPADGHKVADHNPVVLTLLASDTSDACPDGYSSEESVAFAGNDSGVPNVDRGDGCTILDLIWAGEPFGNHGQFVRHVREVASEFREDDHITARQQAAITRAALRSRMV